MAILKKILISCLIWITGSVLTVFVVISIIFFSIILYSFDRDKKFPHAHGFLWSNLLIALNPFWNVEISGLKNIDKSKAYVVVANHQSFTDIVLLYQTKMQFKWLANEKVFKFPFIGWSLTFTKHIKVKKNKFVDVKKVYQDAAFWLKRNMSVMFFPEGTRNNGGKVGSFQNGAFKLAIQEQVPILPISIKGTGNSLPKGSWLFTTSIPVTMKVLEPVDTLGIMQEDFEKFRDLVRSKIEAA